MSEHGVDVDALGVRIRIEAPNRRIQETLEDVWSACRPATAGEPDAVVAVDPLDVPPDVTDTWLMEWLTQRVTLAAIEQQAGRLLMLHACAVANPRTGEALVMVAPSGVGKTTMAVTVGRHYGYVTDETAAVTPGGELLAYPKPLSVVSADHAGKDQRSPDELGLVSVTTKPLPIRGVWLLDRRPGASFGEHKVRTVEGVGLLAAHTSYLAALERPLHRLADLLHRAGGVRRVTYGECAQVEPAVRDLLGEGS